MPGFGTQLKPVGLYKQLKAWAAKKSHCQRTLTGAAPQERCIQTLAVRPARKLKSPTCHASHSGEKNVKKRAALEQLHYKAEAVQEAQSQKTLQCRLTAAPPQQPRPQQRRSRRRTGHPAASHRAAVEHQSLSGQTPPRAGALHKDGCPGVFEKSQQRGSKRRGEAT